MCLYHSDALIICDPIFLPYTLHELKFNFQMWNFIMEFFLFKISFNESENNNIKATQNCVEKHGNYLPKKHTCYTYTELSGLSGVLQ